MNNDTQSRKWLITINNPIDKGFTHDFIHSVLNSITSIVYWCMSDEIGKETHTFHTHIYFVSENPKRFSTILNKFTGAHLDVARGTSQENRDYVFKEGKWFNNAKGETNIRDSHEEYGEMPIERQGQRNDIAQLYTMIKDGFTNYEILENNPRYMLQIEKIDKARKVYLEEQYKNKWRDIEVTYIWGSTGSGKTRGVKEQFGYSNVYTVTDYVHPFDSYSGQDVILFEEFRSNLKISDMLQYLDGYPIDLPCRYANKVACFTKVFFCTNIDITEQYRDVQIDYPETWKAFLRRIHLVKTYISSNEYFVMNTPNYINRLYHAFYNPFEEGGEKNEK